MNRLGHGMICNGLLNKEQTVKVQYIYYILLMVTLKTNLKPFKKVFMPLFSTYDLSKASDTFQKLQSLV